MGEEAREALLERTDALLAEGKSAEAFEAADAMLTADPGDVAALVRAGAALLALGALPEAFVYLEQAAAHDPDDSGILWLLGTTALAGGQGALARDAFEKARERGANDATMLLDLAAASYFALDIPAAKEYVKSAARRKATREEAAEWKEKLAGLTDPHVLFVDVGRAHCRAGRFGTGLEHFMQAFEYGDSFDARLYLGRAMLALGDPESAVGAFNGALDLEPDSEEARESLADAEQLLAATRGAHAGGAQAPPPRTAATPAETRPRFCRQCGAPFTDERRFCTSCGAPRGGDA